MIKITNNIVMITIMPALAVFGAEIYRRRRGDGGGGGGGGEQ